MDVKAMYGLSVEELASLQKEHLWLHLTNHKMFDNQEPQIMVEGKGCMVKDARGNEFLDCLSGGVWGVNVGYGREDLIDAIAKQLKVMPYYAGSAATPPYIMAAAKIASLLPENLTRLYFSNSGSEANEKAFKMSRQYQRSKYPKLNKTKIIYRDRDYHGTTMAALSATGQPERRESYGPFLEGFVEMPHALCYRCPFNKTYPGCNIDCARALETVIKKEGEDTVGAVILEPITAGGGIIPPVPEYYPIIREICDKYDVILIMDEVVNGFGRTGKMFGINHYDFEPDIVTMAKGIASSYMPLSATATSEKIFNQFKVDMSDTYGYFRDISTYGGCSAACTSALESIRIIEEEKLVQNSAIMGKRLFDGLKEFESHPMVGEVRGRGLFIGMELVTDKLSKNPVPESVLGGIQGNVKGQGVLIGRMGRSLPKMNNVLTFAPALVINKEQVDRIIKAVGNALTTLK